MSIVDLTRAVKTFKNIPEDVLARLIQRGEKSVIKAGINESKGIRVLENGVNTVFTDGLNECNGVMFVAKGLDGNPIVLPMHCARSVDSINLNMDKFEKQLTAYDYWIDKKSKPAIFYNVSGTSQNGRLLPRENNLVPRVRSILNNFFKQGCDETIIPYEARIHSPNDSTSMIAQFEKLSKNWQMKLTTVGEKVQKFNLFN